MSKKEIVLLVSEKQLEAIKLFFSGDIEDILYWGAARWWKSETIGMILAIVIAAFPWSSWLIARTILADLKATTLNTFFQVIKRFGYGENSYRDKVRDERHIVFNNLSKLYVIQVNYEPWDPEFDRIWSYGYTGWFLDEWQQMSNKVREVLQGRLSELDGSFTTEVPMSHKDIPLDQIDAWYTVIFKVVGETVRDESEKTMKDEDIVEEVVDGARICYISRVEEFRIPYKAMKAEIKDGKLFHTYSWRFNGCIFTGCNPWTNFTRTEFYKPWKHGDLPKYMAFIPAKVWDNPWVDKAYVTRLERLPDSSIRKQRLLYGNFDYDDNPAILFDQNTIEKMYNRKYSGSKTGYISIDAARQGKDSTEVGVFEGLKLHTLITIEKWKLTDQAEEITGIMNKYGIDVDHTIVDEVWVGWGLVDLLWCKGFIGNGQPLIPISSRLLEYKKRNYHNLRTQAFYYLQAHMGQMSICLSEDIHYKITEELLTVKEKNLLEDKKLLIIPKKLMKEDLGRSPDLADMLSMRMYFIIKNHHEDGESEDDTIEMTEAERDDLELLKFLEEWEVEEIEEMDNEVYA